MGIQQINIRFFCKDHTPETIIITDCSAQIATLKKMLRKSLTIHTVDNVNKKGKSRFQCEIIPTIFVYILI